MSFLMVFILSWALICNLVMSSGVLSVPLDISSGANIEGYDPYFKCETVTGNLPSECLYTQCGAVKKKFVRKMVTFDFLNPLENVTPQFTEEQLPQIVEWFDQNSKPILVINKAAAPTNVITIEQLQTFLGSKIFHRRHFHYPTFDEVMSGVEFLNMDKYKMLTKDQFIYILNRWVVEPDPKHELNLAFKVFDTEKRGFLELALLQKIVTEYDEPFNHDEVIEFIRDANVKGTGIVHYEDFVETMFTYAPELYDVVKEWVYADPDEDPSVPLLLPEPEPEPVPVLPSLTPTPPPPLTETQEQEAPKE